MDELIKTFDEKQLAMFYDIIKAHTVQTDQEETRATPVCDTSEKDRHKLAEIQKLEKERKSTYERKLLEKQDARNAETERLREVELDASMFP